MNTLGASYYTEYRVEGISQRRQGTFPDNSAREDVRVPHHGIRLPHYNERDFSELLTNRSRKMPVAD